jgi:cysteine desulfurase/selenocysteine lyase
MNFKKMLFGYNPDYIYLDHAASTLAFKKCINKGKKFLSTYGSIHRGAGYYSDVSTKRFEKAREEIMHDIRCSRDDVVIFTANTTDGINRFALLFPFNEGDEVLVSDVEHSSNTLPWHKRAKVSVVATNKDFDVTPATVATALAAHPRTVIVALAASSNITGNHIDWNGIYEVCRQHKVLFFLDASQLAPHERVTLDMADVIAYCGHKMYAPFGAGVLAGPKDILSSPGLAPTGGGNVLYVYPNGTPIYKPAPFLHEAGTANGIGAVTLGVAHHVLYEEIGDEELARHNRKLLYAMKQAGGILKDNGYRVWFTDRTENRSPVMIIDNKVHSNRTTVSLLNPDEEHGVFLREGAFCAYRILERLKPELKDVKKKVVDGELNPLYSLIRLSGGLATSVDDIYTTVEKLIEINTARKGK